jgi:hypothetical protein
MGKTPEELNLTDQPIQRQTPSDPRDQEWYKFSAEIEELLQSEQYRWAEDTLRDIQTTVERTHSVSPAQRAAVGNIEAARTNRASRRGEGFGGRRW